MVPLYYFHSKKRIETTSLMPISLRDGEYTAPIKVTVMEGQTVRVRLLPDLDDEFPGLKRASQLALVGASVVLQYISNIDSNVDIGDDDLTSGFSDSGIWRGEVDTVADIPSGEGVWWVRDIENIRWRSAPGAALSSVSSIQNAFRSNARWLTQNTVAAITTHFQGNTYLSNRFYYYYDNGLSEVRRWTRTPSWTTLIAGDEYDEVASDEVTLNASQLQTQIYFDVTLEPGSITENKIDKFRFDIEFND